MTPMHKSRIALAAFLLVVGAIMVVTVGKAMGIPLLGAVMPEGLLWTTDTGGGARTQSNADEGCILEGSERDYAYCASDTDLVYCWIDPSSGNPMRGKWTTISCLLMNPLYTCYKWRDDVDANCGFYGDRTGPSRSSAGSSGSGGGNSGDPESGYPPYPYPNPNPNPNPNPDPSPGSCTFLTRNESHLCREGGGQWEESSSCCSCREGKRFSVDRNANKGGCCPLGSTFSCQSQPGPSFFSFAPVSQECSCVGPGNPRSSAASSPDDRIIIPPLPPPPGPSSAGINPSSPPIFPADVYIGVTSPPAPSTFALIIDDGDPGFRATGQGWQRIEQSEGFGGDFLSPSTSVDTTLSASWTFEGLPPGAYDVYVTYRPYSALSLPVPYMVKEGGRMLGIASVYQALPPTDKTVDGASWHLLGSYTVQGGPLSVLLMRPQGVPSFGLVADAVRVEGKGGEEMRDDGVGVQDGNDDEPPGWQTCPQDFECAAVPFKDNEGRWTCGFTGGIPPGCTVEGTDIACGNASYCPGARCKRVVCAESSASSSDAPDSTPTERAFDAFDQDGNGELSIRELGQGFSAFDDALFSHDAGALPRFDVNRDGSIDGGDLLFIRETAVNALLHLR